MNNETLVKMPLRITFTDDGKVPDALDKEREYVFFVHPEGRSEDTFSPPMAVLVAWIYGDVKNWKIQCDDQKSIVDSIGAGYNLVAYIELPRAEDVYINEKIIKLFFPPKTQ